VVDLKYTRAAFLFIVTNYDYILFITRTLFMYIKHLRVILVWQKLSIYDMGNCPHQKHPPWMEPSNGSYLPLVFSVVNIMIRNKSGPSCFRSVYLLGFCCVILVGTTP